jgi:uncharacterized protein (DUF2252 family)
VAGPTTCEDPSVANVPAPAFGTERLTVDERVARGKAARAQIPRSSHARFERPAGSPGPIELLERQAATRVKELVPIRYGRMLVSPFSFYRGAALITAHDLSTTPRTGFSVQCCGDAHLSNFGVFASPERRLLFDINDFDESLPGPWEWDIKRLAASVLIAARDNEFAAADQDRAVLATVGRYRTAMREFAAMDNLEVWYASIDVEAMLAGHADDLRPRAMRQTTKALAKARTRDSMSAVQKLTHVVGGETRFVDRSPLIVPIEALEANVGRAQLESWLHRLLGSYAESLEYDRRVLLERFKPVDFARKVVGVGSVGTRDWIGLLLGRDGQDPLVLQLKEAEASVLEEFVGASAFSSHGERVVSGQRLMQASSDILLGWLHVPVDFDGRPRDFYARQLRDWKGSVEIDQLAPAGMAVYGRLCGWTLARAHARSGDQVAIASYLGKGDVFDRALLEFARSYADRNDSDYQQLDEAVRSGKVASDSGV